LENIPSGIIGFALRRSATTNAISESTPPTAVTRIASEAPASGASISAYVVPARPTAASAAPVKSSRPLALGSRVSGTWRGAISTTNRPSGRLIRKIARHETASTR
jgi:hypothetical protein